MKNLVKLIQDLFSDSELRRFVTFHFPELRPHLPSGVSLAGLAFAVVDQLERRGQIGNAFWTSLLEERPDRNADIQRARTQWETEGTRRPDADPQSPSAKPYRSMAPPSDQFVHRRELDAVRELLVDADGDSVGITTALRGAGGFGKTALAQALCEDPRVREAYPHGILWAQMRDDMRDADRLAVVQDLVRFQRRGEKPSFETLAAACAHLREVLDGRRVLVVVDDAWRSADVEPFRGLGGGTAVLVTTRDGRTLPADCQRVNVDAMQPHESPDASGVGTRD